MEITKHGIVVQVPDQVVIDLVLSHLRGEQASREAHAPARRYPRIGQRWEGQGGIFAGIVSGEDGAPDYALIIGRDLDSARWSTQISAAKKSTDEGFTDWDLPSRREQRLEFCNVRDLYKAEDYWSKEQHAGDSNYAWCQRFDHGLQLLWDKGDELRARLVRRLTL